MTLRTDVAALYVDPRVVARFWAKVDKSGDCWLWTGSKDRKGYGKLSIGSRVNGSKRPHSAHRIAWVLAHGDPGRACVLHRCDVPACVRHDHLFLGTVADNNRDMWRKGRGHINGFTPTSLAKAQANLPRGDAHYARTQPERLARGERHPRTRLTADDVRGIRVLRELGCKLSAIGRRYGITDGAVSAIIHRRNWSHVS